MIDLLAQQLGSCQQGRNSRLCYRALRGGVETDMSVYLRQFGLLWPAGPRAFGKDFGYWTNPVRCVLPAGLVAFGNVFSGSKLWGIGRPWAEPVRPSPCLLVVIQV